MKKVLLTVLIVFVIGATIFFAVAPQRVDRSMNLVAEHSPYVISKRALDLHRTLIIGDWHADTLLWNRNIANRHDYSHVDLPRLQDGNVSLQMFTTVTKSPSGLNYDQNSAEASDDISKLAFAQRWPISTWKSLAARALYQAEKLHDFEKENPDDLMIIRSQSELADFLLRKQSLPHLVGGLIGTEGSHALDGKLENVTTLYDAGFRMMSLQHFFDNKIGASLHGQSQGGLTEFGREVVAEINRLNIILDVSHSSEKVVDEVLQLSDKPLVVSHTGFKGHCDTARNISDDLMQRIAAMGGLIGIGYWHGAVCGTHPRKVAEAMQYGAQLVGVDHLSLGSDFDGTVTTGFDTSELVALTHALLETGFSENDVRKIMGGNMLSFLERHLPSS